MKRKMRDIVDKPKIQ